ncbi:MAG: hypothetical protein II037_04285, partial [Bacteroidales bacterium]|nr:hypothetical protein [Bacteroidales bacterium]
MWRLLREAASSVPHKRTHKARTCACSFFYKETLENFGNARDAKVAEEDKKYVQDIQLLTA